jgi:hypothetical protein
MANDITNNPLVLDTASNTAVVISNRIKITSVVWAGGTIVAADTMVLKDKDGKIKVEMGTSTADDDRQQVFIPPLPSDGLIAHTIAHGTVYVYWTETQPVA